MLEKGFLERLETAETQCKRALYIVLIRQGNPKFLQKIECGREISRQESPSRLNANFNKRGS